VVISRFVLKRDEAATLRKEVERAIYPRASIKRPAEVTGHFRNSNQRRMATLCAEAADKASLPQGRCRRQITGDSRQLTVVWSSSPLRCQCQ